MSRYTCCDNDIFKLRKLNACLKHEIGRMKVLLKSEKFFYCEINSIRKLASHELTQLENRDLVMMCVEKVLSQRLLLQDCEDILYTVHTAKNFEVYTTQFSKIIHSLAKRGYPKEMMRKELCENMEWDISALRLLQEKLSPGAKLYRGSTKDRKVDAIIEFLYNDLQIEYKGAKKNMQAAKPEILFDKTPKMCPRKSKKKRRYFFS